MGLLPDHGAVVEQHTPQIMERNVVVLIYQLSLKPGAINEQITRYFFLTGTQGCDKSLFIATHIGDMRDAVLNTKPLDAVPAQKVGKLDRVEVIAVIGYCCELRRLRLFRCTIMLTQHRLRADGLGKSHSAAQCRPEAGRELFEKTVGQGKRMVVTIVLAAIDPGLKLCALFE